ncbi:MAG TPA: hypothetical protein PK096_01425 [Candidatus Saccharibacteria bacterium]|nr:hypothetical protein [Candidatus Saccharibacteria bacterium]HRK94010.1 hypothetical protein [Candidatus Saccharibacteria bacterium]
MKTLIQNALRGLLLVPIMALGVSLAVPAMAPAYAASGDDLGIDEGAGAAQGNDQSADLFGNDGVFRTITNVLLFLIGAVSVIMLIIGGIRYTISGGDSAAVTSAKNTILYAIVGIIVALLAYAIVNFVLGSFIDN